MVAVRKHMKTEINIRNGSGWNNYPALRELNCLPAGTRGLLQANGIQTLEIQPRDSERPYGIAARYYDADGTLIFTQGFDQNDTAAFIRERVVALLVQGIQNRIAERARDIARTAFIKRITAWRRNFDPTPRSPDAGMNKLRNQFGILRKKTGRHSRKYCWQLTHAVCAGTMTYRDAVAKFKK